MIWSNNFAYAVGLITTDGNLSKDGRHLDFTSKDIEQVKNFKKILNLKNKIGIKHSGYGRKGEYFRIQFGSVKLYKFLLSIGLCPNKTKVLKSLKIPDRYFIHFLRGHFDGDGYSYSYWDKRWKASFMLYTGFISASKQHINWLFETIFRLYGIKGIISVEKKTYYLKYAKKTSIILVKLMYSRKKIMCLNRKRFKIMQALSIIYKQAGVAKLVHAHV